MPKRRISGSENTKSIETKDVKKNNPKVTTINTRNTDKE